MAQRLRLRDVWSRRRNPFDNMDYIMRFENLQTDFHQVCNLIGLPPVDLPQRNKSNRLHYSHYYDEALVELVRKRYAEDIDYLGYDFEWDATRWERADLSGV